MKPLLWKMFILISLSVALAACQSMFGGPVRM